ncbi:molecular chaperone GroEL [Pantoea ananatis]|uniref:molecular chaperone GroEL n=1 Tax=Pantoea ananas TaxID=553 RepID=UPI00158BF0F1|nr:molecular chaperone GroEL [Pantoea ananatis]MBA4823498.1 molecular chaperone GroEL [Pantoea ananatis]QKV85901.1 molecular chaperone GroEL [Pantoea ananatis]
MTRKLDFANQHEKLAGLMSSAKLKTSPGPAEQKVAEPKTVVKSKARSKNLRAVPETYFEAHAQLKASNKTSLDFSAYILEALREKLENDGALEN